ncbi:undecaprenyl-phosphate glucose phosphotransferase [Massilia antarctica]|uniref:Undecaprenyl-phosphate glucose phosphotransferase n=1 Tax=Massilia antarctica TaxID=2765360 RepID=A0AA48W4X8_9BURK|nr:MULTISPECIES: undecaprenyl-phosphate glucose phosphotransferase [Massilia]MCY0914745.1 undecaprenyl-phosphate glucose phosphotransferase [Massilia sp. H27-R4]QPI47303.1 undecaprenyl-phosphate glucose phosphotransferase [Massilia antarctica]CUI08219.1 Colanic acid biosynthsis UDP-glucose lipid carrier transferase WcaJ [Janthinobacterium sp. CG23_2]CUU32005.1 Colanic acid biosynthsis UDP-glucose lipid carrier transferase WcaJ [Janthinobacterium sp. CG23_2]
MTVNDIPLISFFQRVLDPLIIMGTLYVSSMFFHEPFTGYSLVLMILAFFVSSAVYQHVDPYRTWRSGRMLAYMRDTVFGWVLTVCVLLFLGSASGLSYYYDNKVVLAWFIATPVVMLVSHLAVRRVSVGPGNNTEMRSVVVIGANDVGIKFAGICERHKNLFMQMHGFFDDRTADRHPANLRHPMLGKMADIAAYVREHNIKMIFISQPISAQPRIRKLLDELQDTTASVYFLPDIYVFDLMQARFDNVGGMPVIAICETPFMGLNSMVKRTSDIVLGLIIQLMLLPIMLVIACAVKFTSPGPVIFRQRRYGLYGEEIIVYKFRSMTVTENGDTVVQARKGDQRITRVGAFLRKSSLDELPQFFNVLQGRMSIVGPRPHAVAHNEQYRKLIKGYMLRHKVKPGITGWAQVNGMRGETETLDKMEARIQYDLDYLRSWSLWLDLWIIVKTVKVVFSRENAH